ncbi:MAG: tripartite tricarboxylate transporter substrate binding protein, partial [Desulfovibrio sp.]|nr:tripartite tricarboxylate transporter substrate binding protein [Desulfovibrio sp.]
ANHLTETGVVVVPANSPWQTIQDLVNAAKEKPDYKASTNGVEASNHIAAQLLAKSGGFDYKAIPYGGTADQLLALRQGEVDFSCAKVADVLPLVGGEKPELRVLGVFAEERVPEFPNVPTLKESGLYDKWYGSARGLVAPKGTPPEVIDFYVQAFKKTMEDPANIEAHKKAGLNMNFMDNQQFAKLIQEQDAFAKEVANDLFK